MKQKLTYLLFLLTFSSLIGVANLAKAQSVSGTPSTTGCSGGGTIVAVPTGLGATPQFQLLQGGVVVAPVAGDATQFTNDATFTGLQSATDYTIKARASAVGMVYTSPNITIDNGYVNMTLNTPTKVLACSGGTAALTTTLTGGKGDFVYSIATQAAPGVPLQTSLTTNALTFTFNALPAGNYLVSVTDNCGITSTGATSISNPTVSLAGIRLGSIAHVNRLTVGNCTSNFTLVNELGFRYITNNATISIADAALFTWKIKFQGVLYGQDVDADGFSDAAGAGFSALVNNVRMPLVATRDAILADEPNTAIVLIDACGNQKEFLIRNYNKVSSNVVGQNRCGNAEVRVRVGAGMSCLPINFVFTNTANPADIVTVTQTSLTQVFGGFTPGATYNFTHTDGSGYTSGLYNTSSVTIPALPQFNVTQNLFNTQYSLNHLNYGIAQLSISPALAGAAVTATVTASSNPLVNEVLR